MLNSLIDLYRENDFMKYVECQIHICSFSLYGQLDRDDDEQSSNTDNLYINYDNDLILSTNMRSAYYGKDFDWELSLTNGGKFVKSENHKGVKFDKDKRYNSMTIWPYGNKSNYRLKFSCEPKASALTKAVFKQMTKSNKTEYDIELDIYSSQPIIDREFAKIKSIYDKLEKRERDRG